MGRQGAWPSMVFLVGCALGCVPEEPRCARADAPTCTEGEWLVRIPGRAECGCELRARCPPTARLECPELYVHEATRVDLDGRQCEFDRCVPGPAIPTRECEWFSTPSCRPGCAGLRAIPRVDDAGACRSYFCDNAPYRCPIPSEIHCGPDERLVRTVQDVCFGVSCSSWQCIPTGRPS